MSAYIHAFMTGEKVTEESAEHADFADHGYVDPNWSMTDFQDRNNAGTLFSAPEDDPDLADYVREALSNVFPYADNGDGSFYGQSETTDDEGSSYTYAVHFIRKRYDGALGYYAEDGWHPSEAGITV